MGSGIGYTNLNLPRDQGGCTDCRVNNSGLALNFDRRLTRWFTFDAETDIFPGTGYLGMGSATEGLFQGENRTPKSYLGDVHHSSHRLHLLRQGAPGGK